MTEEKPTIEEILAMARGQDGGGEADPPADDVVAEQSGTPEQSESSPAPSPASDILAAARAQDAAGDEEPAATEKQPAPATGVSDILAAARAQDTGGDAGAAGDEEPAATEKQPAPATGVSDILAAARAQDTGGDAGAAGDDQPAAPAAETAEQPAAADSAGGERPSVQEMLQQLRQTDGATADQDQASDTTAPRPMPTRPAAAAVPVAATVAPGDLSRRSVLGAVVLAPLQLVATPFAAAWTALTAATTAMLLGTARFMFPNTLVEPSMTFKIGPPSDYPPNSVSAKFKAERGVWIVRSTMYNAQDQIVALASVCTHLGCTPNWLDGEQKFKCPCHGSGFYISGVHFEGPAPRPLERVGLKIAADGMLEVDKSKKFQDELGQWEDPASYVNA
ncbi:MAG: hypothetical protein CMJ65_14345 [Planctomycetaceae bacterium]|nr:hypothetical protein [Planctomycetaceae bacterium]